MRRIRRMSVCFLFSAAFGRTQIYPIKCQYLAACGRMNRLRMGITLLGSFRP
ncbi:hypothetical protein PF008_g11431 [Phytophthora fragariae]|uniref:Uncharacterized protein n=1 Tax=Phytophthora fragariae TaxID=53985 RepID=A0A6G0RSD4_9STRA|nr:hypothetical protein PF008_g11431 [Phytophthora fragariae]